MSFRISTIHEYSRFLVVDIGSFRVRTAIFDLSEGEIQCLAHTSVQQGRKNFSHEGLEDMQGVARIVDRAIHKVGAHMELPGDMIVSYTPEIALYDRITTQYIRSDESVPITMKEIDTMIEKIELESHVRARQKALESYGYTDELRLISSTLTSIVIDGKKVMNPIGFTGRMIKLSVLNIFAPAIEFNMVRSILGSLGKRIIALIPSPLLVPKLLELTPYKDDVNLVISIGHTHTTLLYQEYGEIVHYDTFPFGTQRFIEIVAEKHTGCTYLDAESGLTNNTVYEENKTVYLDAADEFLEYLFDLVGSYGEIKKIRNIVFTGGISHSQWFYKHFKQKAATFFPVSVRLVSLDDHLPDVGTTDASSIALALMAQELLVVKKDPVIRILRYILYNYD